MASPDRLRILGYGLEQRKGSLARRFKASDMQIDCTNHVTEFVHLLRQTPAVRVVVVPAGIRDEEWWVLWGGLCLRDPRPAVLVYSKHPTFELWTGVLESGGYDVITEPFTDEELELAVLRAVMG